MIGKRIAASMASILILLTISVMPTYASHNTTEKFDANIVALNDSGVHGKAKMRLDGDQLTVSLHARGLEENMTHAQHIHGFDDSSVNGVCPTMADDTNNDGIVDLGEGLPKYGPIQLALEPFQMTPNGSINYKQTFTVNPDELGPLTNRHIVLHGMTVEGEYVPTLPVACGQIEMKHRGDNNNDKDNADRHGFDITIKGNGSGSRNDIDVRSQSRTRISQSNDTDIRNTVRIDSNTGNNRANGNTGGRTFIQSGDSFQSVILRNTAGFNVLSR